MISYPILIKLREPFRVPSFISAAKVLLFCDICKYLRKKNYFLFQIITSFISSKNSIILLHECLFLVKIITWVLPENFYRENITGNDTVRTFIAIATFILLCLLLVAGLITVKNKLKIPESAIKFLSVQRTDNPKSTNSYFQL